MSYLVFEIAIVARRKRMITDVWRVLSANSGDHYQLGEVRWHAAWRQYTFRPHAETIWNPDCLREIADFCEEHTREHKQARAS